MQIAPAASVLPTDGSARRVSFVYDSQGRRVEKVVETWTAGTPPGWQETQRQRYVWNGWLLLLELNGENDVLRKYAWGCDLGMGGAPAGSGWRGAGSLPAGLESAGGIGGLLAVEDANGTPATTSDDLSYVFCYDANGNVGQVVDLSAPTAAASLAARYEYDPYGQITGPDTDADGDWRDDAGAYASTNAWRLSTKQWDDETGLGYWGYRYYSARLGRWVSRDPIGERGGLNLQSFGKNAPMMHTDALGLACKICFDCKLLSSSVTTDGATRNCEYVCTETSRQDQGIGLGEGCDELEEQGLLPPKGKHVITTARTVRRTYSEYWAGCKEPQPCPGTVTECRGFAKTAAPLNRNCSRAACRAACSDAKKDGTQVCDRLKGTLKLACKLAIVAGEPACRDMCDTWCLNP